MSISLKTINDKLKVIESYKPTQVKIIIDDSNHLKVTKSQTKSLTDPIFSTGKWCFIDWTLDDRCNPETYRSAILPLELMRTPKQFCVNDCYLNAVYQGLRFDLSNNTLRIDAMALDADYNTPLWIRYLSVFKYYLNTVLGWVM